ncbi:MAG: hypothetical protein AAFY41_15440, partial [Bacteroidota bacterium]
NYNIENFSASDDPRFMTYVSYGEVTNLEFKRTPTISTSDFEPTSSDKSVTIGEDTYLVLDAKQQELHTVNFTVEDQGCSIKNGYVLIKNPGASSSSSIVSSVDGFDINELDGDEILEYDSLDQTFEYSFIAGNPNMAFPYTHLVEVYYLDQSFNIVTSAQYEYIVLGESFVEGSDVLLDPVDQEGNVDVPFYVLRDPPGDNSYSYLEKGTEFSLNFTTAVGYSNSQAFGVYNEFEAALVANTESKWAITVGGESTFENKFTFKANEKITTAKKSVLSTNLEGYLDGKDADVIVGAGLAFQYGIVDDLVYDATEKTITKEQNYNIQPTGIKTVWHFNRSTIEQTIKYYESLLGTGNLPEEGYNDVVSQDIIKLKGLDNSDDFLRSSIANWKQVLKQADFNTHPMCKLVE